MKAACLQFAQRCDDGRVICTQVKVVVNRSQETLRVINGYFAAFRGVLDPSPENKLCLLRKVTGGLSRLDYLLKIPQIEIFRC